MRMLVLCLSLCIGCWAPALQAHKIVGIVYADGWQVEGEIGFSDGVLAAAGVLIEVTDAEGQILGQTRTEAEGVFNFTAKQPVAHYFNADLGAGHVIRLELTAEELPGGGSAVVASQDPTGACTSGVSSQHISLLRKDLAKLQEKLWLHDILGGLGYILGVFGLWAYIVARRQMAAVADAN